MIFGVDVEHGCHHGETNPKEDVVKLLDQDHRDA